MDFKRRLRLFLIGVVLGSVFMYFYVFRKQDIYKGPDRILHDKIGNTVLLSEGLEKCRLSCAGLTPAEVRKASYQSDISYKRDEKGKHGGKIYLCTFKEKLKGVSRIKFELTDSVNYIFYMEPISPCYCDSIFPY